MCTRAVANRGNAHQSFFCVLELSIKYDQVTSRLCKRPPPLFFSLFLPVIIDSDHIIRYLYCGNGSAAKPAVLIPMGANFALQVLALTVITERAMKSEEKQKKNLFR